MTTFPDKIMLLRMSTDTLRAFREGQLAALAACAPKSFLHVPENLLAPRFDMPEETFRPAMQRGYAETLPYYRDGMLTLAWAEAVTRNAIAKGVPTDDPIKVYLAALERKLLRELKTSK